MATDFQAAISIYAKLSPEAKQAFDEARKQLRGVHDSADGLNKKMGELREGLKLAIEYFAVKEIAEFGYKLVELANSLQQLSQKTGISVQMLSDFRGEALRSGLAFEGLEAGLKKFSATVGRADSGNNEAQAGFKALGISVQDSNGKFKTTDELLLEVADRFAQAKDGAGKTTVAIALFGRAGADMIPFLNQGRDAIEDMGVKMSEDFVHASHEFHQKLVDMKIGLEQFGVSILEKVLPALNSMIDKLGSSFTALMKWRDGIDKKFLDWIAAKVPAIRSAIGSTAYDMIVPQSGAFASGSHEDKTGEKDKRKKDIVYIDPAQALKEQHAIEKLKATIKELGQARELEGVRLDMTEAQYQKQVIALEENLKAEKEIVTFTSPKAKEAYRAATQALIEEKQAMIDLREQQKETFGAGIKEALRDYSASVRDVAAQTKNLFTDAFRGIEDALVQFVTTGELSFTKLAQAIEQDLARIAIRQAVIAPLLGLVGSAFGGASTGGSSAALANDYNPQSFPFASGGVMTSAGMLSLNRYAGGGIANSPQLAIFGEGRQPEAYVPLPDGRSIPVSMKGAGGGGTNVQVNVTVASSGQAQTDSKSGQDQGRQLGQAISAAVTSELIRQKRPGGLLA